MNRFVIALFVLMATACAGSKEEGVMVRFEDPAEQAKYLAILDAKRIKYASADDGWITVEVESIDDLKQATPEYDEWRKAQVRRLNDAPGRP